MHSEFTSSYTSTLLLDHADPFPREPILGISSAVQSLHKVDPMNTISAIYENGLFRPLGPVTLPEGTRVVVETEEIVAERVRAARRRVFDSLNRSSDSGIASDVLKAHNDHQ